MNAIAKRLLPRSSLAASILAVLESLRCGGFLLDLRGRVLSLNLIAVGCLGDGLALGGEFLSATDRETDRQLQCMIGSALKGKRTAGAPTSLAVPRYCRLPLVVRTVRLDEGAQQASSAASLLLLAFDPELRSEPPRDLLIQTFGLTPAEADVAVGIVSGKSLTDIAAERGVKVGTVRAHSKTLFSKTHTRGQADLTGMLTRMSFLVPQLDGNIARVRDL